MGKRFGKAGASAAVVLVGVTLACASNTAAGPIATGVISRPTIGPNRLPNGPSVHEVEQTTTLAGTSVGPATATCPPGEVALGGGWELPSPASGVMEQSLRAAAGGVPLMGARVFEARLLFGNVWAVSVSHPPLRVTQTLPITAYVECLAGAHGAVVRVRERAQDEPPSRVPDEMTATCETGEVPVGFGFDFSASDKLEFLGGQPTMLGSFGWWSITVVNHDFEAHPIVGAVACLSQVPLIPTSLETSGPTVGAGTTGGIQQPCPQGAAVAGGSIQYSYKFEGQGAGNLYLQHASSTGWRGAVYASLGSTSLATDVGVVCVKFS